MSETIKAKADCCEEASSMSAMFYIPCNRPASRLIGWEGEGPYRMCDACARHNVKNRRASDLGKYIKLAKELA